MPSRPVNPVLTSVINSGVRRGEERRGDLSFKQITQHSLEERSLIYQHSDLSCCQIFGEIYRANRLLNTSAL